MSSHSGREGGNWGYMNSTSNVTKSKEEMEDEQTKKKGGDVKCPLFDEKKRKRGVEGAITHEKEITG